MILKRLAAFWTNIKCGLDEATRNTESIIRFQSELFRVKTEHDFALSQRSDVDIIFVERSVADIYAYSHYWLSGCVLEDVQKFLLRHHKDTIRALDNIYSKNVILKPNLIPLVNDGIRPTFEQDTIHSTMMAFSGYFDNAFFEIGSISINDRVTDVMKIINGENRW